MRQLPDTPSAGSMKHVLHATGRHHRENRGGISGCVIKADGMLRRLAAGDCVLHNILRVAAVPMFVGVLAIIAAVLL